MYLAYALTVAYCQMFPHQQLLPVWLPKFSPAKIFPMYGTLKYQVACQHITMFMIIIQCINIAAV